MSMGNNDFFFDNYILDIIKPTTLSRFKNIHETLWWRKKLMGNDDIFIYQIFNIFQFWMTSLLGDMN